MNKYTAFFSMGKLLHFGLPYIPVVFHKMTLKYGNHCWYLLWSIPRLSTVNKRRRSVIGYATDNARRGINLKPGVGNRPVITYVHLSQVYRIA